MTTTYSCQRCRTSLKLHESLQQLNPASFDLLVDPSRLPIENKSTSSRSSRPAIGEQLYGKAVRDGLPPVFKQSMPAPRRGIAPASNSARAGPKDNPDMSFIMLTQSQVQPPPATSPKSKRRDKGSQESTKISVGSHEALSRKVESHDRLFEILSSHSDIDHPVCAECTELLLVSLENRLSASSKERDAYISFLKDLKNNVPTAAEVAKARDDYAAAKAGEDEAFAELLSVEKEKSDLEDELADLVAESQSLDVDEQTFWRSRNAFVQRLSHLQDTRDAQTAALEHDQLQLERLRRTNVYNDTFCVGHDKMFGTINGLRLGRMPSPNNVEWAEINAAWGLAALLLTTVAERLGFTFQGYKIRPMGSTTYIDKFETVAGSTTSSNRTPSDQKPKVTSLGLFSSGDVPIGLGILHRRFNEAMVAFLQCIKQLGVFVARTEASLPQGQHQPGFKLLYPIEKDLINETSIKLGTGQDEAWTSACKYALTNCKLLLAHVSSVEGGRLNTGGDTRQD